MIKANELRIGNYILFGNNIDIVEGIRTTNKKDSIDGSKHAMFFADNCLPITLTPEILERCGFTDATKEKDTFGGYLSPRFSGGGRIRIIDNTWDNRCWITEVKYLHQLQNLYFALTGGEELEFKND